MLYIYFSATATRNANTEPNGFVLHWISCKDYTGKGMVSQIRDIEKIETITISFVSNSSSLPLYLCVNLNAIAIIIQSRYRTQFEYVFL